jgi:hypothetical protein
MRLFFIMNNKGERRFDDGGDAHVMELVNDVRHVFGEAADVGAVAGIDMGKAMAIRSQDPTADDTMGLKIPLDASLNARLGFLGMMRGARAAVRLAAA